MEISIMLDKYLPRDLTRLVNEYTIHHRREWTRKLMKTVLYKELPWHMPFVEWKRRTFREILFEIKYPDPEREFQHYVLTSFGDVMGELGEIQNEIDCHVEGESTPQQILMIIECM